MRPVLGASVALLVAGAALIALSVSEGGARVALFVVVPVISGTSAVFLVGVLLLIVGFFSLPFSLAERWEEEPSPVPLPARAPVPTSPPGGVGGFVLIGPVPIVFGTWKGVSHRVRWMLALAGAVLLTLAIVALVLLWA